MHVIRSCGNSLKIFCFVAMMSALLISGCNTPVNTPTAPVTYDSQITIIPCGDDPEGDISFDNVTVRSGVLDTDYMALREVPSKSGDPCILINGRINNNASIAYWVAYHAYGYDEAGNEVAFTLDAGPILGVDQAFIGRHSSGGFTLHLSWSDKATSFKLFSQKSEIMFP